MTSRYGVYLLRAVGIVQDNQQSDVIKELLHQQIVGCKCHKSHVRMLRKLVIFDSGFAVWALGDEAYVSLFSWDLRIPRCVGAIAHVDCDGWTSPY